MQSNTVKHIFFAIVAIAAQLMIFKHLRIFGAESDIVLIFLIWLMAFRSRTSSIIFAACLGLALDALLDLWGLHLFAKVATVMLCYNFIPSEGTSKPQLSKLLVLLFAITLFHNLLMIGLSLFVTSMAAVSMVEFLIGNTVFTTFLGAFIYIFKTDNS